MSFVCKILSTDMKSQKIKTIDWEVISNSFRGELENDERERLETWLKASPMHREFYERAKEGVSMNADDRFDEGQMAAWKKELMEGVHAIEKRRRAVRLVRWTGSVAAVLLVGMMLVVPFEREQQPAAVLSTGEQGVSHPAGVDDEVVLILSDGKQIGMSDVAEDSLQVGRTAIATAGEKKLVYGSDSAFLPGRESAPEMNKVVTSTGGFYTLVLSDGTRVWLNSESELEYPVVFGEGERCVNLKGEAFFEVARDASRPFVVEAGDVRTKVLGTSFNIKAYANEPTVAATLFSGRVEVAPLKDLARKVVLTPGNQASWNDRMKEMSVHEADLSRVAAWKEGLFIFKREGLEEIARQIERWYGVEFVFRLDEESVCSFSGSFSKYESLKSILEAFSFTGELNFEMNKDTVFVTEMPKK